MVVHSSSEWISGRGLAASATPTLRLLYLEDVGPMLTNSVGHAALAGTRAVFVDASGCVRPQIDGHAPNSTPTHRQIGGP